MTTDRDRCCAACLHWDEQIGEQQEVRRGFCRRNQPIAVMVSDSDGTLSADAIWPSTYPDDWCGRFAAKQ